jgi:hypothetical protein
LAEGRIHATAFDGKLPEKGFRNLDAHGMESRLLWLVLVVIAGTSVDLTDTLGLEPAEHFGKHTDFQRPPLPHRQAGSQGSPQRAFAGERVAEAL